MRSGYERPINWNLSMTDKRDTRIAELERENAELKQLLESARAIALSKQAKIDALMLEYCRNEIPQEQLKEWARHQRPVDAETTAVIDAAIASKKENDRG